MNYNVTPLFPIPLYQTNIGKTEEEISFIKSQLYVRMPSDNGSYTENKRILDCPELVELRSKIQSHINYFLHEVLDVDDQLTFKIQNSWVNLHNKKDFAGIHKHSNSIVSGIYYPEVNDDSGALILQKEKTHYNLWSDMINIGFNYQKHNDQEKLNIFNSDAWGIYPKIGDLVLFPSMLLHSVTENQSEAARYSLAFNTFPQGNFGDVLNSLTIS